MVHKATDQATMIGIDSGKNSFHLTGPVCELFQNPEKGQKASIGGTTPISAHDNMP